jgi:hypothetical protein
VSETIRKGSKVRLINTKGLSGYGFYRFIKKGKIYTVRKVKPTGGILLEEVYIGENMFGNEQGIMADRFRLIKRKKQNRNERNQKRASKAKERKSQG